MADDAAEDPPQAKTPIAISSSQILRVVTALPHPRDAGSSVPLSEVLKHPGSVSYTHLTLPTIYSV